jgi:uncharacterized tellurite resistance protein B-like protein
MWDDFIARLRGTTKTQELPEPDEKLALGALLVRVAKSDNFYHVSEIIEIDHILANSFNLNAVDAAKLRATSEKLEAHAPDTSAFATLIRESVDYTHRLEVVEQLWKVILADGRERPVEHAALHEIENHLGINPADSPAP